jgi:hypothetical protein
VAEGIHIAKNHLPGHHEPAVFETWNHASIIARRYCTVAVEEPTETAVRVTDCRYFPGSG